MGLVCTFLNFLPPSSLSFCSWYNPVLNKPYVSYNPKKAAKFLKTLWEKEKKVNNHMSW